MPAETLITSVTAIQSSRLTIARKRGSATSRRGHCGMKRSGGCQMTLMIVMRGADKEDQSVT